jgi:Uma2 family endonuclease
MAVAQRMSEDAFQQFVLTGAEGAWELHDGRLVEKPAVTWNHGDIVIELAYRLRQQFDRDAYRVFTELRVRRPPATVLMPDFLVVPTAYGRALRDQPTLAIFADPLPLVVEVWSPSTGDDVDTKVPVYQQRGDREIWRIHPFERTLTSWQRQRDGSYRETVRRAGSVTPVALPGVTIDLDDLFEA